MKHPVVPPLDAQALQAHVDLHCEIDAHAAELRAWVRRQCEILSRFVGQQFRWRGMVVRRP